MNTDNNKKTLYAVVVLFSNWPLRQICAFLEEELGGSSEQVGVMRIDRSKGKETNRTIMLVNRTLLTAAEQKGFTQAQRGLDFKVTEYELRDHNRPKAGFTRNFYVPLPEDLPASDANAQLENKIDVLCRFGMFSKNRPRVKIPLVSRESEKHQGRAFVTFGRESDDDEIALARILLNDTKLYKGENDYTLMRCLWAKERSPTSSPRTKKDKTEKKEKGGARSEKKGDNRGDKRGDGFKKGGEKRENKTKTKGKVVRKQAPAKKSLEKDTSSSPSVTAVGSIETTVTADQTTTEVPAQTPTETKVTEVASEVPTQTEIQTPPTGLDFPPLH